MTSRALRSIAQDVVQSAYLSAFRALSDFEGACQLSTWLHRIVVNTALMKLRSVGAAEIIMAAGRTSAK